MTNLEWRGTIICDDPASQHKGRSAWVNHLRRSLVVLIGSVLFASCARPEIQSFLVGPRRICPATRVVSLSWAVVKGSASLSADQTLDGMGCVAAVGQKDVPAKPATVTLEASRLFLRPDKRQQIISDVRNGETTSMAPDIRDITCAAEEGVIVATLTFEPSEYDSTVTVTSLRNK